MIKPRIRCGIRPTMDRFFNDIRKGKSFTEPNNSLICFVAWHTECFWAAKGDSIESVVKTFRLMNV